MAIMGRSMVETVSIILSAEEGKGEGRVVLAGQLGGVNRPFLPKKRHFRSRIDHYPRFFGHFLKFGTRLAEPEPSQNWLEAESG